MERKSPVTQIEESTPKVKPARIIYTQGYQAINQASILANLLKPVPPSSESLYRALSTNYAELQLAWFLKNNSSASPSNPLNLPTFGTGRRDDIDRTPRVRFIYNHNPQPSLPEID